MYTHILCCVHYWKSNFQCKLTPFSYWSTSSFWTNNFWPYSLNFLALFLVHTLVLFFATNEWHFFWYLSFSIWFTLLSTIPYISIHVAINGGIFKKNQNCFVCFSLSIWGLQTPPTNSQPPRLVVHCCSVLWAGNYLVYHCDTSTVETSNIGESCKAEDWIRVCCLVSSAP